MAGVEIPACAGMTVNLTRHPSEGLAGCIPAFRRSLQLTPLRYRMNTTLTAVFMLTLATTLLLAAGCETVSALQVRGQVVEVVPRSFSELESLTIRDDEGRTYTFETEGFVGFTTSHVREHQFLGQTLLVTYEKRGDVLVAIRLED